jgi:Mlc titration factor MtfA (ptsG expression regulator)
MGFGIFYVSAFLFYWMIDRYASKKRQHQRLTNACPPPIISKSDIVLRGGDLGVGETEMHRILSKRYHYYSSLDKNGQRIFLKRLQKFIHNKSFIIKDDEGFKEMPLLVSAAAIQLTFGLNHYLLPFYKYIRIYPQEYVSDNLFKVLAGNVQDNIITIAWNHLLKGYENNMDGSNVGLHEMSHALYIQKMEVEKNYAKRFAQRYNQLLQFCELAHKTEQTGKLDLYSDYACKNLQEFWAESVELFFEKPQELQKYYPDVFIAMITLLNQNPAIKENPVIKRGLIYL